MSFFLPWPWPCPRPIFASVPAPVIGPPLTTKETKSALSFGRVAPKARIGLSTLQQGKPIGEAGHAKLAAQIDKELLEGQEHSLVEPPASYVGFVLTPSSFEFYNGGHPAYLNDRFLYLRADEGAQHFAAPVRLQA